MIGATIHDTENLGQQMNGYGPPNTSSTVAAVSTRSDMASSSGNVAASETQATGFKYTDQGREEQEEACGLGYAACLNNCNKRTLGASCVTCCGRKNVACKLTGDYEFEACFK